MPGSSFETLDVRTLNIGVIGYSGKLGLRIVEAADACGWQIGLRADSKNAVRTGPVDILFECASHFATETTLMLAKDLRVPVIFATSGRTAQEEALLELHSASIPIVVARNLTIGNAIQRALARVIGARSVTAETLVVDRHPITKKDAPSATAKGLAALLRDCEIKVLREGGPVADHSIVLDWQGEQLEIVHRVMNLTPVVSGALRALEKGAALTNPGLYTWDGDEIRQLRELADDARRI